LNHSFQSQGLQIRHRKSTVENQAKILYKDRGCQSVNETLNIKKTLVSVVVPVYCGAAYLADLAAAIDRVRIQWEADEAPLRLEEAIFVDDDAIDESASVLDELAIQHHWIRVLHLSRNFGQHPATVAGILHSCGDWVVTLDEDLQHPPEFILSLLAVAVSKRLDVVYAKNSEGVHESLLRDLGSRMAKHLTGFLAGDKNVLKFNSFRLIRGAIARSASSVCGSETYFDIALSWFSRRTGSLELNLKDQRFIEGKASGYSMRKLLSHTRRLIMSSQVKVLRIGAYMGMLVMILGFIFALYVMLHELVAPGSFGARGWSSLIVSNWLLGGMTLFLLGASLEYLAVLAIRAQGKPAFFVIDRSEDALIAAYLTGPKV
jgi:polyisoprenyl-phosphate glycosyltransferase